MLKRPQIAVYCDDREWFYKFLTHSLHQIKKPFQVFSTQDSPRQTWDYIGNMEHFVFLWDGKYQNAGELLEQVKDINSDFDFSTRVIVFVVNPLKEDIMVLSELGVKKIIRVRQKESHFPNFQKQLESALGKAKQGWEAEQLDRINKFIGNLSYVLEGDSLKTFEQEFNTLISSGLPFNAKSADLQGCFAYRTDQVEKAKELWYQSIEKNPNYFPAYHHLLHHFYKSKQNQRALGVLRRLQNINSKLHSRSNDFADVYLQQNDPEKAQNNYQMSMNHDPKSSRARSGLAKIHFYRHEYLAARQLMHGVENSYDFAATLNQEGVSLVRKGLYEQALDHYAKAQYVLPQHDADHKLIFNIALCCYRWERYERAKKFLEIALIKSPDYDRARNLLDKIKTENTQAA